MSYPNLFNASECNKAVARINNLTIETQPQWGKMNVAQMLAHCAVPYAYEFESEKYGEPATGFKRFMMRALLKSTIAGKRPYKKNSRTAPDFLITDEREFETEKARLIGYIGKVQNLGAEHFHGKITQSIGPLSSKEWNVMFAKHLDHHLTQFGV